MPSLNPSLPPSGNFNLSTWNLTLPTGTAGHPDVISTTKLDSGYTSQYFYTGPDGAMTFWCPDTGVTTSGSSYPRTELRETKSDGTLYNWNVLDGTATLNATLAVNVVPGTGKIVIGQIHDNGAGGVKDEPLLKVIYEYSSTTGTGKIVAQIRSTPTSSNTDYTLATGIKLNTLFSYQIQLRSDLTLSVQINGVTEYSSGPIDTSWESQGLYFKAGDYDQDNVGPSTDGGQVSFYSLTVTHASTSSGSTLSASTFLVTGYASPTTAGASHSFTITAKDTLGNTATGYVGTITFTSSDPKAILPANYTFTSADAGVHIFSATLKTAGSQSITATDTATASITGKESGITVNPAAASKLVVSGYPSPTIAGISHSFTITAQDAFGNTASGYTGTVAFTSSDGQAALPANYGFTSADGGVHSFAAILKTAGSQSITATDTATSSITGKQSGITVNPAAANSLTLSGFPATVTAGSAQNFTVTAFDAYGNVATGYTGTVHITSTDAQAVLPADYTFGTTDSGKHTFSATLKTAGTQSLTATDTVTATLTATESGISVSSASTLSASTFLVTGYASPTTAGASYSITVTAQDTLGNTATGYVGTITFTSSDPKAILPANYTFTSADAGVHIFSATLKTAGSQSITATDTVTSSITGTQSGITVNPAAVNHLVLSRFPSTTTAGVSQSFRITVQDLYGNTVTSYTGTVTFASTDIQAVLPANYTFTSADAGIHTFSATLKTAGSQSLTAKDVANSGIAAGTMTGIKVVPAATSQLQIAGFPLSLLPGSSGNFTVTVEDAYGNITTSYVGTVKFTSSDGQAILPANYTFTSTDAGVHTFSATLKTPGTQSISATDTVNSAITGSETGISVVSVRPTASLSGPSTGVPGQPLTFSLGAIETGLSSNTIYSFSIQWGDGSPAQSLSGLSGTQVSHACTKAGAFSISLTATDPSGNPSAPALSAVTLTTVLMETDPYNSSLTALYIGGTTGNDTIAITPVAGNGVQAAMNFVNYGSYFPTGHVVVYGQSGNDIIKTAATAINGVLTYVNVPALFFAGDGTDTLNVLGSTANNVLVGGAGADNLIGGQGRDLLIGGSGPSTLRAGSGGDILIGGTTSYDNNVAALAAVLAEWSRTDIDYATRIGHLNGTISGGLNGSYLLNTSSVQKDGMVNDLYGGAGLDWYFAGVLSVLFNKASGEIVTQV